MIGVIALGGWECTHSLGLHQSAHCWMKESRICCCWMI
jgi:hypothetical protein